MPQITCAIPNNWTSDRDDSTAIEVDGDLEGIDPSVILLGIAEAFVAEGLRMEHVDGLRPAVLAYRQVAALPSTEDNVREKCIRSLAQLPSTLNHWPPESRPTVDDLSSLRNSIFAPFKLSHTEAALELAVALANVSTELQIMEYLEEGIRLSREGLARMQDSSDPDTARIKDRLTDNLAFSLRQRHRFLGDMDDLDEVIATHRTALRLRGDKHSAHRITLHNLADALSSRFYALGDESDLEEAIALQRRCLATESVDWPDRPSFHSNLASSLSARHDLLAVDSDLDESIAISRTVLEKFDPRHPEYHASQHHIANALCIRYKKTHNEADIDEAISSHQAILSNLELPADRGRILLNLSLAHLIRFRSLEKPSDANEALRLAEEVLRVWPEGHPERSRCCYHIASLYLKPSAPYYNVHRAFEYALDGTRDQNDSPYARLHNAIGVLSLVHLVQLTEDVDDAFLGVLAAIVSLLPQVANFGMDLDSRLRALESGERIGVVAAGQALLLNRPEQALELIEEGRNIFWTQAFRLRTDFDDLPETMRKRLVVLAKQLEQGSFVPTSALRSREEVDTRAVEGRRMVRDFEAAVEEVRSMPHYDMFMLPQSHKMLTQAGEKGPVVVLVVTERSCDAIVITSASQPARLPLPITMMEVLQLVKKWHDLTSRAGSAAGRASEEGVVGPCIDDLSEEDDEDDEDRERAVKQTRGRRESGKLVLSTLWTKVVKVVIESLSIKPAKGSARPRLWWCPTGQFALLPLHAAGIYNETDHEECCTDFIVSSYIPTVQALIEARSKPPSLHRDSTQILLAGVRKSYTGTSLPATVREIRAAADVIPSDLILPLSPADDVHVGSDGVGTQTVIQNLPKAQILHLASHGCQVQGRPLESGFLLRDGLLTISQLMEMSLPRAFLAFLSACETAKGDDWQADQTVHLAGAMLFCGFRSVIGTMWSMHDVDGPHVAKIIYQRLFQSVQNDVTLDTDVVTYALDEAVQSLRKQGISSSRWATYIHIGV